VRSPTNPTYWWGNFLLFDEPPYGGDGERWERLFAEAFAEHPEVTHVALAWDRPDGEVADARTELVARGFELEVTAGLVATPDQIHPHPRGNADVEIVVLDPAPGRDPELWEQVTELQLAQAPGAGGSDYHRAFLTARQVEWRGHFQAGNGCWYVALDDRAVVGSLGIVVRDGRARYQMVDTAASHRRRGIATRLVVEGARHAASLHPIDTFVIAADPDYHAIAIYESVGFARSELVTGALRKPPS
jgi:ribosomal protein S18 acetylase RimI-like enzyme